MKKSLGLMLVTILFSSHVIAQIEIKIISYNVLEGLGNEESYGVGRHERCVKWLQAQNAEVIALQELYESEEKLSADAKDWGHKYYAKAGPIGLTSKEPLEVVKKYKKGLWHGVLHCKTYGIDFFVVHLSPADWKYRLRETEIIKGIVDSIKQTTNSYILLGDFNAHSPFDGELYKQNPELIEKYKKATPNNSSPNLVGDYLDYSVMSSFYSFPLIDITERFVPWYRRNTFPSPILIGVWRTAGNIGRTPERIDYILTTHEMSLNCKEVTIHNSEETDYISDHYPIEAVFEIGNEEVSE
jgi:endonuclease/exonuclease/phosphatase family metal-dependent hydrolase